MKPVLIFARPLDQRTGQRIDIRAADGPNADVYGTAGVPWMPGIVVRPTLSIELMSPDMDGKVQAGKARFELALSLLLDKRRWQTTYWRGASCIIHSTGALEGPTAVPDFSGYIAGAVPNLDTGRLSVTAEVSTKAIDKDLLWREFGGGGGLSGDPEKRGVLLPVGAGPVKNIEPIWFDLVRNIGMIDGYGNTLSIDWLGEGLSSFGPRVDDYPNYAALAAAIDNKTIPPGRWGSCVAEGLVGLGAPPVGVITVHATFRSNRIGALMKRVILDHARVAGAFVDTAAFDALDGIVNKPIEFWTAQQRNTKDLLEALAQSCNATPLVTFQNRVTVTRAVGSAPVVDLDRSGAQEPRVLGWSLFDIQPPFYQLKARTARPARVLTLAEVLYTDTIEDKGLYKATETYRAGALVWLPDGSQWLYQNALPSSDHAPPAGAAEDGNGDVQDAWWFRRLAPAPLGMTDEQALDLQSTMTRVAALSDDDILTSGSEKSQVIIDYAALYNDYQALDARYAALGSPADITASRNNALTKRQDLDSLLTSYTPAWDDISQDTPINGTAYRNTWSAALQAVSQFRAAITGRKGDDGISAYNLLLTNENITVPAATDGTVLSYANTPTSLSVLYGSEDVTSSFSPLAPINPQGLTLGGAYPDFTITGGFDAGEETALLTFRVSGGGVHTGVLLRKALSLSKSKAAANGVSPPLVDIAASSLILPLSYDDTLAPGTQDFVFTARRQNTGDAAAVFSFQPGHPLPYAGASVSGDVLTVTAARMREMVLNDRDDHGIGLTLRVIVTCGTQTDYVTVTGIKAGQPGLNAPLLRVQWSIDGSTNWHDHNFGADRYYRQSNDGGVTYGPAILGVGEDGNPGTDGITPSNVFVKSNVVPPTPQNGSGIIPPGWYDKPPEGTAFLWLSKASFRGNTQLTDWSTPSRLSGADGATSFTLIGLANVAIDAGTTVTKISGGADWNGKAKTLEGYIGAAISGRLLTQGTFIGLTTDPDANLSYDTIDYAAQVSEDGNFYVHRNGPGVPYGGGGYGSIFAIVSDTKTVRYTINGQFLTEHPVNDPNETLYGVIAIYREGQVVDRIVFAPNGRAGDDGASPLALSASPPALIYQATYTGSVKPGNAEQSVTMTMKRGDQDVTSSTAWSVVGSANAGCLFAKGGRPANVATIYDVTAAGYMDLQGAYNGVSQVVRVNFVISADSAPPATQTSGAADVTVNVASSTYDGPRGQTTILRTNGAGQLTFNAGGEYSVSGGKLVTLAAAVAFRPAGSGGWSFVGESVGSGSVESGDIYPGNVAITDYVLSGLTAGASYEVGLGIRKASGSNGSIGSFSGSYSVSQ